MFSVTFVIMCFCLELSHGVLVIYYIVKVFVCIKFRGEKSLIMLLHMYNLATCMKQKKLIRKDQMFYRTSTNVVQTISHNQHKHNTYNNSLTTTVECWRIYQEKSSFEFFFNFVILLAVSFDLFSLEEEKKD